jgi:hypothetical protein
LNVENEELLAYKTSLSAVQDALTSEREERIQLKAKATTLMETIEDLQT